MNCIALPSPLMKWGQTIIIIAHSQCTYSCNFPHLLYLLFFYNRDLMVFAKEMEENIYQVLGFPYTCLLTSPPPPSLFLLRTLFWPAAILNSDLQDIWDWAGNRREAPAILLLVIPLIFCGSIQYSIQYLYLGSTAFSDAANSEILTYNLQNYRNDVASVQPIPS